MEGDDSVHFRIGTALDILLTDPDRFDSTFHVASSVRPKGYMCKFIDALPLNLTKNSSTELYKQAYSTSGYSQSINTVVKNLWSITKNFDYYLSRIAAGEKTVLSVEEYEIVALCKKELLTNPFTQDYFLSKKYKPYFQVPFYFELEGVKCKGMLDLLVFDHKEKTIKVIDLKTSAKPAHDFPFYFCKYGYHVQAYFYWYAVKEWLQGNAECDSLTEEFRLKVKDYTLQAPEFMVVSKIEGERALNFGLKLDDMQVIWQGGDKQEGVKRLMERWVWHTTVDMWEFPLEVYQNDGKIPLNMNQLMGKIEPSNVIT